MSNTPIFASYACDGSGTYRLRLGSPNLVGLNQMPLHKHAKDAMRRNLEEIQKGNRVGVIPIGHLTNEQLIAINARREAAGLPPIINEVLFVGGHIHKSRIVADGYTIDDVLDQISSGMDSSAVVLESEVSTVMENQKPRSDAYGNCIRDQIVLECSRRYPCPELYSVIPKGDKTRPQKQ